MNNTTNDNAPSFETACADMDEAEVRRLIAECADEKYKLKNFAPAVNEVINAIKIGRPKEEALDTQAGSFGLDRKTLKRWVKYRLDHPIVKK